MVEQFGSLLSFRIVAPADFQHTICTKIFKSGNDPGLGHIDSVFEHLNERCFTHWKIQFSNIFSYGFRNIFDSRLASSALSRSHFFPFQIVRFISGSRNPQVVFIPYDAKRFNGFEASDAAGHGNHAGYHMRTKSEMGIRRSGLRACARPDIRYAFVCLIALAGMVDKDNGRFLLSGNPLDLIVDPGDLPVAVFVNIPRKRLVCELPAFFTLKRGIVRAVRFDLT